MPERKYEIIFSAQDAELLRSVGSMKAGLADLKKTAEDTKAAVADVGKGSGEAAGEIDRAAESTGGLGLALEALAAGAVVLSSLTEVARGYADALDEARQKQAQFGRDTTSLRDQLREYANLRGADSPDDKVLSDFLNFRLSTGTSTAEARTFLEQFEGSLPAGLQKGNITRETADQLAIVGGQFAARTGLSGAAAGDLTGVLSQYGQVRTAEQGAGQLGAIGFALNEGRGNLTPLVKSLLATSGALVNEEGGPVRDLMGLAAILGVASTHANPAAAGTRVQQAFRALNHFETNQEGEGPGALMERLGITPQMGMLERMELMKPFVDAAAAPGGRGADLALREAGIGNQAERKALVTMLQDMDIIKERVERASPRGMDAEDLFSYQQRQGAEVLRKNERFLASETGAARVAEAAGEAATVTRGLPAEGRNVARRFAEAQLKADGEIDSDEHAMGDAFADWWSDRLRVLGMAPQSMRDLAIDRRVRTNLGRLAGAAGVDLSDALPGGLAGAGVTGEAVTPEGFNRAAATILANRGKIDQSDPEIKELLRELIDTVKAGTVKPPLPPGTPRDRARGPGGGW